MAVLTRRFWASESMGSGGFQRIHETVPGNPKNQAGGPRRLRFESILQPAGMNDRLRNDRIEFEFKLQFLDELLEFIGSYWFWCDNILGNL